MSNGPRSQIDHGYTLSNISPFMHSVTIQPIEHCQTNATSIIYTCHQMSTIMWSLLYPTWLILFAITCYNNDAFCALIFISCFLAVRHIHLSFEIRILRSIVLEIKKHLYSQHGALLLLPPQRSAIELMMFEFDLEDPKPTPWHQYDGIMVPKNQEYRPKNLVMIAAGSYELRMPPITNLGKGAAVSNINSTGLDFVTDRLNIWVDNEPVGTFSLKHNASYLWADTINNQPKKEVSRHLGNALGLFLIICWILSLPLVIFQPSANPSVFDWIAIIPAVSFAWLLLENWHYESELQKAVGSVIDAEPLQDLKEKLSKYPLRFMFSKWSYYERVLSHYYRG